ncbi:MAG: hypothetical protein HY399_08680 [Elusimicrobia bacterium]|nr:hypothetical protein [Elusimicrobiota bacterium]
MRQPPSKIIPWVLLILIFGCAANNQEKQTELNYLDFPPGLLELAKKEVPKWLGFTTDAALSAYGFKSRDEFKLAGLDNPIPLYAPNINSTPIPLSEMKSHLLKRGGTYYAPVLVGLKRANCLLQISRPSRESIQVDGIGFEWLAQRLNIAQKYVDALSPKGHLKALVQITSPMMDLVLAETGSGNSFWLNLTGGDTITPKASRLPLSEVQRLVREAGLQHESMRPGELGGR